MRPLRYERPRDVDAALTAISAADAVFLGGGTNLVDLMRLGVARPAALVDVTHLGLDTISSSGGVLRIGAGVRNSDLAADPEIRARYPVLARAVLAGASGQIRNMATTAGNLLQRTRCLYFQQVDKPCNKREPGSGCPAREGEHRDLAILGGSSACIATHPSDLAVALAALDAELEIRGPEGTRTIALTDLYRLPGQTPERDTVLERTQLITAVLVPALAPGTRSSYAKVRDRASYAFAVAAVAASLRVQDDRVREVRIALGAVAPVPWRARRAEERLLGREPTAANVTAAIEAELAAAEPLRENAFKVTLTRRLAVRTLLELATEAA